MCDIIGRKKKSLNSIAIIIAVERSLLPFMVVAV